VDLAGILEKNAFIYTLDTMNYYALQVKTRSEEKYIRLFKALHPDISIPVHFPQRKIEIRRRGHFVESTSAIFPGYVFVETDNDEIVKYHWAFRRTDGFYRFLRSNQDVVPLAGKDLEVVLHFIKKAGPVAGKSLVYFNEDSRIIVTQGPLMGLEGKIIKVDKRKGRAKIKLDLYGDSFSIDLAFEVIGAAKGH
jgi:transcriptional antiterminator NusG